MCVLSIKVPIRKKSGNLFNDPRICIFSLFLCIYACVYKYASLSLSIYIYICIYIYIYSLCISSVPDIRLCRINNLRCNNFHYIYIYIYKLLADRSREWPEDSFFDSYNTEMLGGRHSFSWTTPLTLNLDLIMLSGKQVGIKYHFLSLRCDSTRDWNPVSQIICEHYTHAHTCVCVCVCVLRKARKR